jgi:hypothetical protein
MVVGAAGDDISLPERTGLMAEVWEASGRRATSIYGRWVAMDVHGRPTREEDIFPWPETESFVSKQCVKPIDFAVSRKPSVSGCSHAFSKSLFAVFGPLPEYLTYEDTALAFRSVLAGQIYYVNKPVVKYRRHADNTYFPLKAKSVTSVDQLRTYQRQVAREFERYVRLYDCFRADAQLLARNGDMSIKDATELESVITRVQRPFRLRHGMFDRRLRNRLRNALELIGDGCEVRHTIGRLLPRPLYEFYFLSRARLRNRKGT